MPYRFLAPIWRRLTPGFRLWLTRRTQTQFTASAAAVVLNDASEVLLLNHALRPSSGWGLPGGFLDAGERPEAAIRRELTEETGIGDLADLRLIETRVFNRHIEFLFAAGTRQSPEVKSREITELGWFPADRLPDRLPQSQKHTIERVIAGEI